MIKIIVVDDDLTMHEKVKKIVRKAVFNLDKEIEISCFTKKTNELMNLINDISCHKIYILDIELENNNSGIQIAKRIRENDWDSQIIFMTNHDKMFETVYRNVYQVFDFIEKFHNFSERLEKDTKLIINQNFNNKMFFYSGRNVNLQIYLKSILYIYRDTSDRKLVIVTEQNKYSVSLSLQEIINELDNRFKMVHRACIANDDHVEKYDWTNKCFILDTGEKVNMLSKKYKKEVNIQ